MRSRIALAALSGSAFGDGGGIGLEAEQAGADLVVQFERGAAAFVVLGRDEPAAEREILGACGIERAGERIETVGDRSEFQHLGPRQPHLVVAVLEAFEALAQGSERIEHAAEHEVENPDHDEARRAGNGGERHGVLPDLGDLVARLADDLHRADGAAVHRHGNVVGLDRRPDQRREPARRRRAILVARTRRIGDCNAGRVAHADAHVTHGTQLYRQGLEQWLGWDALLDQLHGFAHHQLGEPHRRRDLDARCCTRLEDGDAAGNQGRDPIDRDEHDEKLHPHRAAEPQGIEQPRAPRCR